MNISTNPFTEYQRKLLILRKEHDEAFKKDNYYEGTHTAAVTKKQEALTKEWEARASKLPTNVITYTDTECVFDFFDSSAGSVTTCVDLFKGETLLIVITDPDTFPFCVVAEITKEDYQEYSEKDLSFKDVANLVNKYKNENLYDKSYDILMIKEEENEGSI